MRILARRRRRWSPRPSPPPARDLARVRRRKFAVLSLVTVFAFTALTCQLFRLQVLDTDHYLAQADGNRLALRTITPPRGLVRDRTGRLLAENVATFTASLIPADLPRAREQEVYATLQSLLGVPAFEIESKLTDARRRNETLSPVIVKRDIGHQTALILAERSGQLPGLIITDEAVRVYPAGQYVAHMVGYIGRLEPDELNLIQERGYKPDDRIGKAGVELTYESQLRGTPGRRQWLVDASGRELRLVAEQSARPGNDLVLAVDVELQEAVTRVLMESVADLESKKAVAILMDVRTGELLADVSLPAYDNNIFAHELDDRQYEALTSNPDKPLLDHSISEKFPPGSTFKIVTAAAALQEGVATPGTTIVSNGALLVPRDYDRTLFDSFPDWRPGLGALSFYEGLAMSSDVYFYCLAGGCDQLPQGLGSERIARYARDLGFAERTGIDLPGETDGLVGDARWLQRRSGGAQNWFLADTYYQGIGQGYVEATPLQVVRMTTAIANGGNLLRPKVVREIRDADGNLVVPPRPEILRRVNISDQNLKVVRDAMRRAITDGTAGSAKLPNIAVAGKTGTAEFGTRLGAGSVYGKYKEHGWFTGFAPYENPEVAVVVFHQEGGGALTAAPTAARVLQAYFDLKARRFAEAGTPLSITPADDARVAAPSGNGNRSGR